MTRSTLAIALALVLLAAGCATPQRTQLANAYTTYNGGVKLATRAIELGYVPDSQIDNVVKASETTKAKLDKAKAVDAAGGKIDGYYLIGEAADFALMAEQYMKDRQ